MLQKKFNKSSLQNNFVNLIDFGSMQNLISLHIFGLSTVMENNSEKYSYAESVIFIECVFINYFLTKSFVYFQNTFIDK